MRSFKYVGMLVFVVLLSLAATSRMPVYEMVVFEGSEWCVKCISLEKNVLSDSTFTQFLEKNKIKLKRIDFPQRKKQKRSVRKYNQSVAEHFNFDGTFPTLLLVDNAENEVSKINYADRSTEELIQIIRQKIH